MKRFLILGAAAVACIAIAFAALPFLISSNAAKVAIIERLEALTGKPVEISGEPSVMIYPFIGIEVTGLTLGKSEGGSPQSALLTVDQVQAHIDGFSAVFGKIKIKKYQFVRPRLNLSIDDSGQKNWNFETGQLNQALSEARQEIDNNAENLQAGKDVQLGTIIVMDGALSYDNQETGRSETFTAINGTLDWPTLPDRGTLTGQLIFRGEQIAASFAVDQPLRLVSGGESPLTSIVNSEPFSVNFDGVANTFSDFFIMGDLRLSSPSFLRMSEQASTPVVSATSRIGK